jgi:hypothetical protein
MPLVSPGAVYVARLGYHDNAIGSAESDMGGWATAAAAWNAALAIFDPTLAAQIAEAETGAKGAVTPEAAALFRAALAAAPAAEARLREPARQAINPSGLSHPPRSGWSCEAKSTSTVGKASPVPIDDPLTAQPSGRRASRPEPAAESASRPPAIARFL